MVSKYFAAGLFGLAGLVGCSPDASANTKIGGSFYGDKVAVLYETGPDGGGPSLREGSSYLRPVPSKPQFLDGALRILEDARAYTLPVDVFRGNRPEANYSSAISILMSPSEGRRPDKIVIADTPRELGGDLRNVYFIMADGKGYKLVEADKQ